MNGRIRETEANKVYFAVVILNLIYFLGAKAVDRYCFGFLRANNYLILIINQFYFVLFPVLLYLIVKRKDIKEALKFNKFRPLPGILILLISVPAYMGVSSLNVMIVYVLQSSGYTLKESLPTPQNLGEIILSILVVAVSPAICEEILHRGILLKAYESRGSISAVVISSILFGIFHFDLTNLSGPIFLGMLIGYYVIRTDSIFAGMLAHFANNFLSVLVQYYSGRWAGTGDGSRITEDQFIAVAIFGVICFVVMIFLLICFHKATRGKCELKLSRTSIIKDIISVMCHWPILLSLLLYIVYSVIFLINQLL